MNHIEMLHGALTLVQINADLKPTERALIVCDTDNITIATALAYAVKSVGAEYSVCIMEPRSTHGEDPTEAISKAMLGADVIFAPTRFSLSHSNARIQANENGARFISMPDYTEDMLRGGALDADFLGIYKKVSKLVEILTKAENIHVETAAGTDITMNVKNRIGNEVSGVCREAGTWGSPPNIEVNVSPIELETQGVVVVDGSIPMPEIGIVKEPIVLKIVDGRIKECIGGAQGDKFMELLHIQDNMNNNVLAEFGIGLNDKAELKGSMLEDEGAYRTCHFGFGHNADQGGENNASVHIDVVYCRPTVTIDGKVIIKEGELNI